ncbi:MAG: hypothetical protein DDT19_01039 [Syntrophomonadaceae bacterium]|nr:hypothetical protein [Bacillota bacterium]
MKYLRTDGVASINLCFHPNTQQSMLVILVVLLNIVLSAKGLRVMLGEAMALYLLKLLMEARNTDHCAPTAETILKLMVLLFLTDNN